MILSLDCGAAVVKSDSIIHPELRHALRVACVPLENASDKDWHPGSGGKVHDLVHPSLFPLVYGRSRALPFGKVGLEGCEELIGEGDLVRKPTEKDILSTKPFGMGWHWASPQKNNGWSRNFQWLPCDVVFLKDNEVEITSYINNLHPAQHQHLYSVLERIIAKSIPLWDEVLSSVKSGRGPRIVMTKTEYKWPQGQEAPEDYIVPDDEQDESYGEEIGDYERQDKWEKSTRVLITPDADEYVPFECSDRVKVDLRARFADQGLQIIVKLANIELTPDKPEYEGGSWHIEGQLNEHICASALYYYDSTNVSDSFLGFRHQIDSQSLETLEYGQEDYEGVEQIYGVEQHGPAIQEIGRVLTKEGRLLAFPNVLQHQVSSFRLADASKSGHRKILALFLVDPAMRILSTANVPPQQKSWLGEEVLKTSDSLVEKISQLPNELVNKIVPEISFPTMTLEEAKELRLKLMEERKAFVEDVDKVMGNNTFNFCEH